MRSSSFREPRGRSKYLCSSIPERIVPCCRHSTLDALNSVLKNIPLWQAYPGDSLNGDYTNCFAPNRRGLEVALQESQFRVDQLRTESMGGYVRATAITEARVAKYQQLDSRLERTPFDPTVPYFLDEPGSIHKVTEKKKK